MDNHSGTAATLLSEPWDVIVIGGGNAAVVSAMSAQDQGAKVLILERADVQFRGGNSRHTRNIRCIHSQDFPYNTGAYTRDELWKDLCSVGTGPSDEEIASLTVQETESVPEWMMAHGALFQPPLAGTLHLGRTNTFFLGGGKALLNNYYRELKRCRIPILYEAKVERMLFDGPTCTGLVVNCGGKEYEAKAAAYVCAAGGFEANVDWLAKYWGEAAYNYHIRGPKTNDGTILRALLDAGADRAGQPKGFHAVAVDARSPMFDGGIATRLDCIPFGMVLNRDYQRFYDEGEEIWPKRYAIWGRNIAEQPGQVAYAFWDSKAKGLFMPPMYGVFKADTVAGVAEQMGLDGTRTAEAVARFNSGIAPDANERFNPAGKDGVGTTGLEPNKTNWARAIDTGPFYGIKMAPGITFTYMGVKVNTSGRIQMADGSQFTNLFAAGEIMSGNVLSSGYMAGFGMAIGTVWGRISGREAARHDFN